MKLNAWLGMVGLLFLSGCATVAYTPYDLREPSRVAKNPSDVIIISNTTQINKEYKEMGIVEASSEISSSGELIEELRKEAAKRGADAVINIQESRSNKTSEGIGSWIGGTSGYFIGNNYISGTPGFYMPGGSDVSTVLKESGTAIIFIDTPESIVDTPESSVDTPEDSQVDNNADAIKKTNLAYWQLQQEMAKQKEKQKEIEKRKHMGLNFFDSAP